MTSAIRIKEAGRQEKILVVQTSFLGDVVLTTPLISEIKRRFPEACLTVLCKAQLKGLLENHPDIDEVLTDDKGAGLRGLRNKAEELRQRGFTLAISPHKSFRTGLLLFLAGIPSRIGFRQSAGWFFYHHRVEREQGCHDVERNLSILRAFGIDPADCRRKFRFQGSPQVRAAVARTFEAFGVTKDRGKLLFGISPGSVWPMKRWDLRGYANVIIALREKYACQILLFGAPEDREIVTNLQELTGQRGIDLVGRFSLRELPSAIEWCDLFIGNDTGPMHIAVACGVPVVGIFCATTPSLGFYPYSSKAIVVGKQLHCRPCSSHGGLRCPLGTEDCIRLIRSEHVLNAVRELLDTKTHASVSEENSYLPHFMTL